MKVRSLSKVLLPVAVIVSSLLIIFNAGFGVILIVIGVLIAPIGWVAMQDDKNIDNRDRDFSQFTKMLGSVVGGMGVTIKEGITKIDMKSIGSLQPLVKKLYVQLIMGMEPHLCWLKFVGATGSDLIDKFTYIFLDAIELGGDANKVGKLVNTTNLEVVLLRMKRKLVSSSFTTLIFPMHAAMTGLVIFIVEILVIFSSMLTKMYSSLDFGASSDIGGGLTGGHIRIVHGLLALSERAHDPTHRVLLGPGHYPDHSEHVRGPIRGRRAQQQALLLWRAHVRHLRHMPPRRAPDSAVDIQLLAIYVGDIT
jgi:flagellar protein FlaJ